ncbi:chaperone protein DnaJ [Drosophila nasuta]|uniref:chaperone protein DnaJ n=1 Tax=Drosophila nasuta TaxID=42062 RepID=UPI00295F1719|nr:chaperone protein DnaJ [Drosophila nasuta]
MITHTRRNFLASFRYISHHSRPRYPILNSRKNYYDVLNVPINSSIAEIKQAYIKLSKKYHPDGNSSTRNSGEFVKVCEAYKVLYKRASRQSYDDRLRSQFYMVPPMDVSFTSKNVHNSWKKYQASMRSKQFGRNLPNFHGSSIFQKKLRAIKNNSSITVIPRIVPDNLGGDAHDVRISYPFNSSDYKWNLKFIYYLTGFSIIGALLVTNCIKKRKRHSEILSYNAFVEI